MIKFEIIKNAMDSSKNYYEGITLDAVDQLHETEASFNTEEEALEALKEYESTFVYGRPKNDIVEYFIEVNEYNKDGEWIAGGDIVAFTKLKEE